MSVDLGSNVYNRDLSADQRKFKLWSSAGLMLSYWCSSSCACCYVYCGPETGSPSTEMSVSDAIKYWRGIGELAGQRGRVHLTGGEPFGDYERLKNILREAQRQGLKGLEKIETNAYWCVDDKIVRERLKELKDLGLTKLQVSTDAYHQEYVPIENVRRLAHVALEVLGEKGFQARWQDYMESPDLVDSNDANGRDLIFTAALAKRGERMLGRAADELSGLLEHFPCEHFNGSTCRDNFLGAKHIHIDGLANIFSGTCVGIIVGNVLEDTLESVWKSLDYRTHPVVSVLIEQGPIGLLELAEGKGYCRKSGYASKCHLCYDIRRFLYSQGCYPGSLGPGECYGVTKKDQT